jgi:hypothetical protein
MMGKYAAVLVGCYGRGMGGLKCGGLSGLVVMVDRVSPEGLWVCQIADVVDGESGGEGQGLVGVLYTLVWYLYF